MTCAQTFQTIIVNSWNLIHVFIFITFFCVLSFTFIFCLSCIFYRLRRVTQRIINTHIIAYESFKIQSNSIRKSQPNERAVGRLVGWMRARVCCVCLCESKRAYQFYCVCFVDPWSSSKFNWIIKNSPEKKFMISSIHIFKCNIFQRV